jgi:peptide deformylase
MAQKKKSKGVLLQVAQLGQPVLRKKAPEVKDVKDQDVQRLIDDLIATVMDVDGVGISAPQVYRPLRLFIVASHPSPRYPNAPKMKPTAIINPKIISASKKKTKDWEGCLSVPGVRGFVPRYKSIFVEYTTKNGRRRKRKFEDFIARIFQHEHDHLEGLVFLDRLESTKDIISEKEYQRRIKIKKKAKDKKKKSP